MTEYCLDGFSVRPFPYEETRQAVPQIVEPEALSLIKTWCTRRMSELPTVGGGMFRYDFGHDLVAPTPHRLGYQCLPFARGSHPRKPGPPPATLDFARKATSPATQHSAQVVLDRVAKALGWLEKASDSITPRTVVGWHRAGFRLYWRLISGVHKPSGRKPVSKEIRALIFRMAAENPTWGAPRIHGELLKLGFDISEPSVSRWLRRVPRTPDPAQRWLTFFAEPSRSHCRDGLLHGADADLWRLVLLLCDWS